MKIATMIHASGVDFENRKKVLARKEMDQAYKKHAKYAEANKNPMLATLENLLSGKTDKEVHAAGAGVTGVVSYTRTTEPDDQQIITGGEVSIQAPQLREATVTPTQPSRQDLRVAARAEAQIQVDPREVQGETLVDESDVEPYANEDASFNVPERFQTSVQRDPQASTLFGRDLEQLIFKRTFKKATEKYMSHVAMVRNSYLAYNEPQFVRSA